MPRSLPFQALALLLFTSTLFAQGFTPDEAVKRMKLPDGFTARCVASEPMIRQPLSISFDSRGRLWVLQFLQYPNPAGLKAVKQDQYLRTTWDKVPEPPPNGPKGADRITILSEPDANGVYTKSKDFVTGLNLASGFCLGDGGVYVVQAPYLLFYPDKDEDDVPDGDPQVLLTGFGMDDTHSLANSLQWGPDGWLYGAAGSTSTSKVANPDRKGGGTQEVVEFQQGVWRYHPKTKRFELFSEGGGNTYGLDFDRHGQCITGTNWGGFAMLHQMQGAYYVKGFSKHGPLHNPHAYGYFDHVPYTGFKGGHVTCGGILYEADAYPEKFRGQYIAGNLLSNAVYWHTLTPKGGSFTAAHGGELLEANDTWFRPVDLQLGPDGCVYVADWYDKRAAHLDPLDTWDKTNGRVYRIEYTGYKPTKLFDLRKKSAAELVELLKHPNVWWRREARRLLGEQTLEADTAITLKKLVNEGRGQTALEALWVLDSKERFNPDVARKLLADGDDDIRNWAIRLVGEHYGRDDLDWKYNLPDLATLAESSGKATTLAALMTAAKRMNGKDALNVVTALVKRSPAADDPALPLLTWWAIEAHWDDLRSDAWLPCAREIKYSSTAFGLFLLERLARLAVEKQDEATACGLALPFDSAALNATLAGFEQGLSSAVDPRFRSRLLERLQAIVERDQEPPGVRIRPALSASDLAHLRRVMALLGDDAARAKFLATFTDTAKPEAERVAALQLLTQVKAGELSKLVPDLLAVSKSDAMLSAGIAATLAVGDAKTSDTLIAAYPRWSTSVKSKAVAALLSRPAWALALFKQIDVGTFPKADLTVEHARAAVALNDKELTALVEKQFGKLAATPGEKKARIDALNAMLGREKPGDAANGRAVFAKACAACHQMFGEGGKVGPDLTSADRKNRGYMLAQVVDPSGYIRPEFVSHKLFTRDGRTLVGVVTQQSAGAVTLAGYANGKVESTAVPRADIESLDPSPVSLMPEKLLDAMNETDIRDLFAFLASDPPQQPPASKKDEPKKETAKKFKVALVSGSVEYKSDDSLAAFQKVLEEKLPVECVRMFRKTDADIPGIEKLAECDLAIFFTRRLTLEGDQLDAVKKYAESGKPIVGVRTASHGFQKWLEMDKLVYGGDYQMHNNTGPKTKVAAAEKQAEHPILKGVAGFETVGSLYRNKEVAKDVTVLLTGTIPDDTEPVAWVRERKVGEKGEKTQRIFYTSLGHPDDFGQESFRTLLLNAIKWAANDERLTAKTKPCAYTEIRVVDAATGRGVPLAELETVNHVRFVTDNAGRIAINEPELMGREVFFSVKSHGYEAKKDGFGVAGVRITPKAGEATEVKLTRVNVAERLCRLTGQGTYRDTLLLGKSLPLADSPHPGHVAGQDSVQAVPYKGEVYWFWGDTQRLSYPLGLFRMAGAKTAQPAKDFDPAAGIPFDYFTGKDGFARAMIPMADKPEGVVWIDGVCTVSDDKGSEKLVCHYSRRKGLTGELEHGVAELDDAKAIFEPMKELPLTEKWRHPSGQVTRFTDNGKEWLLFGNPTPNVRVPATLAAVLDPKQYEAFTCASSVEKGKPSVLKWGEDGAPAWRWQSDLPPMVSEQEEALVKSGTLKAEQSRFLPVNAADAKERVRLHSGTVQWNEHRKRWVLVACQIGGKASFLGEVWYAEAREPTGPFSVAVKVATHEKQSLYNVCHHPFLDRDGGRTIHFEGTYTSDFSGSSDKTPRYDYNQVLYRLDLDAPVLKSTFVK